MNATSPHDSRSQELLDQMELGTEQEASGHGVAEFLTASQYLRAELLLPQSPDANYTSFLTSNFLADPAPFPHLRPLKSHG